MQDAFIIASISPLETEEAVLGLASRGAIWGDRRKPHPDTLFNGPPAYNYSKNRVTSFDCRDAGEYSA